MRWFGILLLLDLCSSAGPDAVKIPVVDRIWPCDWFVVQDDEQDSKYPGPTAWIDVEEGEMAEAAESLVKVFTKLLDDEDALLRQMASAAAPAPADETLRDPLGLGAIDPSTLKLVSNQDLLLRTLNCLTLARDMMLWRAIQLL